MAAQPDRAGRYRIQLSDGSTIRLYKQTVQDFGLYSGLELTQEEYEALCKAASEMSAKMRAVRIVSATSVSRKDLEQRLIQKGEDAQCAKKAVAWMEELSLVDDAETARQIVSRCISKGYGISRAKQALYEKRIPKSYWDQALEGYPSQAEYIQAYIQSHLPRDPEPKMIKKVVDALMRKGHSYHTIRSVLGDVLED